MELEKFKEKLIAQNYNKILSFTDFGEISTEKQKDNYLNITSSKKYFSLIYPYLFTVISASHKYSYLVITAI